MCSWDQYFLPSQLACIMVPLCSLGLLLGTSTHNWVNQTYLSQFLWNKLHRCLCPHHNLRHWLSTAVPSMVPLACYKPPFLQTCATSSIHPVDFAPLFPSQSLTEREWGPQQSTFHASCDGSCLPCSDSTCLPCGNSTGSNASGMLSWGFPPHCGLSISVIIDSRAMIQSPPFAKISCCLLSQPTVLSFKALQVD